MGRVLLAGLVAGVAMFVWSALAHTVLPLGETGLRQVGPDSAVPAAVLQELGARDGLYSFPGVAGNPHEDKAAYAALEAKMKTGGSGLIVYRGPGDPPDMGPLMGIELALEIAQAIILAWVLSKLPAGLAGRTLAGTAVGVAVGVSTNGSYWNWWGFPVDYTLAAIVVQVVGYALAGLVAALILGWKAGTAEA
ncbi:MAG: hypothetical protein ACOY4K_02590 [Pseudomonadota bacterium]